MSETTKKRAKRNQTLTIQPEEVAALRENVMSIARLSTISSFDNLLIHADLYEVLDEIPNEIADLIVLDPPYNLTKKFHGLTFNAMNNAAYEDYLRSWFGAVCNKLKPTGSLYICGDWKCTAALQSVVSENLTIINRITWQREKGRGSARNWKNSMEDIWFAVKDPKHYYFNVDAVKVRRQVLAPYREEGKPKDWKDDVNGKFRDTCPSNFWDDISVPFWAMPENTDHPTQKPEKLLAKLILASSQPGDLVFDPFMGSGTSCVVSKKLERRYLGVDINEEYCLWAAKRIQLAHENKSIQGYADGVFWERNTFHKQHDTAR